MLIGWHYMINITPSRTTGSAEWLSMTGRTIWAARESSVTTTPLFRLWDGATMKWALCVFSPEREYLFGFFCVIFPFAFFVHRCLFFDPHATGSCATSSLVTVDTSTSWSVTATVGSTNTSRSLAPIARPLRSSPSAVSSSNGFLLVPLLAKTLMPLSARC